MEHYPLSPTYTTYEFFYDDSFLDYAEIQNFGILVQVGTYRVRAEWTPELADEVRHMHTIDVVAELEKMLEQQLNQRFTSIQINELADAITNRVIA